ncbi:hypothetical protein G9409_02110 [Chlorobium sp. BLA1]|uniref:hypothetical protein n=1 Tax=Candidatus Chlorobium masyuteum TaxID=2716876 RepID=UPI001420100E|nr:hypothetical protein [Candidatus Chlorobium masyuteum]NHQ59399.1 hypothetical protein [Candidatus Chlorobium masyuteum]
MEKTGFLSTKKDQKEFRERGIGGTGQMGLIKEKRGDEQGSIFPVHYCPPLH